MDYKKRIQIEAWREAEAAKDSIMEALKELTGGSEAVTGLARAYGMACERGLLARQNAGAGTWTEMRDLYLTMTQEDA